MEFRFDYLSLFSWNRNCFYCTQARDTKPVKVWTSLNLSKNDLTTLPDGLLAENKMLTSLDLSQNQLEPLSVKFFEEIPHTQWALVDLRGNPDINIAYSRYGQVTPIAELQDSIIVTAFEEFKRSLHRANFAVPRTLAGKKNDFNAKIQGSCGKL